MRILRDPFLDEIEKVVLLRGKRVLEIGCGNGARSTMIARRCEQLVSLEPNPGALEKACAESKRKNIFYVRGSAHLLPFRHGSFDAVIFTLSLHHIAPELMQLAIEQAALVNNSAGPIIFFEPGFEGSFFEAELLFDACDGDERDAKRYAYETLGACGLVPLWEINSETIFQFDCVDDFVRSLNPKRNRERLGEFLAQRNNRLRASRKIIIFEVPQ